MASTSTEQLAVASSSALRTTLATSAALSTAVLPFFLLGALSVSIQDDLELTETAIGLLATVMFVSSAVTATPAGLLVERIGAGVALRLGVLASGVAAAAIGFLAHAWWQMALPFVVVGFGVALIDTGGARAFADRVGAGRQGLAFGIKEASIPAASMLAGLSLPTIAGLLGWRATFTATLAIVALVLLLVPSPTALGRQERTTNSDAPPRGRIASPSVVRFAAGLGMGTGSATAGAAFLVPALVDRGLAEWTAGLALAVASVASITMRITMGWLADRPNSRPVLMVSWLLLSGAVAALVLASDAPRSLLVAAAVLLLGGGWAWVGLAFLAVVRANPATPAAAAGVVLTGLGVGGSLGPLAFGAVADGVSFAAAWLMIGAALLAASALVRSARQALDVAGR